METDLLEIVIGSFTKEIAKARAEAILKAIDKGYLTWRWVIYSETPNQLYMECRKVGIHSPFTAFAVITYNADMRPDVALNAKVEVSYV